MKKFMSVFLDAKTEKVSQTAALHTTSKTSKSHILVLKLTDKLDLRIGVKVIALSNLSIYYTWRMEKHKKLIQ